MPETAHVGRRLPLIALLSANVVSQVGNAFSGVAIPLFVYATTGSAAKVGLTATATVLPMVLASFFGGVVVDRLGHRRACIVADLSSGTTVAAIPLLHHTLGLAFWQLLVLVFLGAVLDTPGEAARQSLIPTLAATAGLSLVRVNAAYQAIRQTAGLLGPPLAGLLVVLSGASNVLWLDAASFVISAGLVLAAVPTAASIRDLEVRRSGYLTDLREGLAFLRGERTILTLALLNTAANFVAAPLFGVVLPVYAARVFGGSVSYGVMLAASGIGALTGSVLYGALAGRASRRAVYVGSWVGAAIPFWLLVGMPALGLTLGALAFLGLVQSPINPLMYTLTQERTPTALQARVIGTRIALANLAVPLGMASVGFLLEALGLRTTLLLLATIQAILAAVVVTLPALRSIEPPAGVLAYAIRPIARPRRSASRLTRDWRWVGFGVPALVIGSPTMPWLIGRDALAGGWPSWTQSTGLLGGAALFALGWVAVAAGLRLLGSRRRGALCGLVLYLVVGLLTAAFATPPAHWAPITAPSSELPATMTILVTALTWPVVLACVLSLGPRRR